MDRKLPQNPEIQRLIHLGAAARSCLESEATALRHRLDLPSRFRDSLKQHPAGWMLGSLASGLAASLVFRRKPSPQKKRRGGIPATLLALTLTAARPLAKIWLGDQVKNWLTGPTTPAPSNRFLSHPSTTSNSR